MRHNARIATAAVVFAWLASLAAGVCAAADEPPVSFAREIKPLLARRCFACHGPSKGEGGLHLDRRESALAELDSGNRAIVPGDLDSSALVARVTSDDDSMRMPPEGKPLAPGEVEALRRWIVQGAKWEKHWAFVPPQRHAPPTVEATDWADNEIDRFVLAKLQAAGLKPAPRADKRTLVRRAYFDLIGLPPTYEEVEAFVADSAPDAWERLIDQLLARPQYGEHWARHWLDLVRFAETNSFERDGVKPNAWRYRDYVIRSFNDDKPYDQFLREQLAGDELQPLTRDGIIATGYYRLGIWDDEPADPLQAKADEMDDLVSTTGQVMLGLTIGCARCHDHKIDPILQRDYYGLAAFFADVTSYGDTRTRDGTKNSQWDMSPPPVRERRADLRRREGEIRKQLASLEKEGIARMSAEDQRLAEGPERAAVLAKKLPAALAASEWAQYQETTERLQALEAERAKLPPSDTALALAQCVPSPQPTHLLMRGNPHAPGDVVAPQFPELFAAPVPSIEEAPADARSAGRRRVLADWIAAPGNMLTSRVMANRVWQNHFGRGIVRTASNFGELGSPPTHPELLDWLALWLVDHEWRLKPLHRLIMTSQTYQMSSHGTAAGLAKDPTNDLLWRFDMRRLSAEEIRDAALLVTGQLNPQVYGRGFFEKLSPEVLATQSRPGDGWGESSPQDRARRSIYIHVKRSLLTPLLTAFDFPDVDMSCEARFNTIQPGQALSMLNGEFLNEQAAQLAARLEREAPESIEQQVAGALKLALARAATADEVQEGLALVRRLREAHGLAPAEALRYWCLAVLNLNEFVYLD